MKVIIDLDGTITANPDFFRLLIHLLSKNGVEVHILTARKPSRNKETNKEFEMLGLLALDDNPITAHSMSEHSSDWKKQMQWKIDEAIKIKPDMWIDNDFKMWDRIYQVDVKKALPKTTIIQI